MLSLGAFLPPPKGQHLLHFSITFWATKGLFQFHYPIPPTTTSSSTGTPSLKSSKTRLELFLWVRYCYSCDSACCPGIPSISPRIYTTLWEDGGRGYGSLLTRRTYIRGASEGEGTKSNMNWESYFDYTFCFPPANYSPIICIWSKIVFEVVRNLEEYGGEREGGWRDVYPRPWGLLAEYFVFINITEMRGCGLYIQHFN